MLENIRHAMSSSVFGGGGDCAIVSDREFLDNFCTVSVSFVL